MPKILIIRFSSIGDIVLTTPIIRCVKQQVKDAEVHYLTKKNFSDILKGNPYIDKIHTIEKNVSEIISELRKENFDFIVDLHHNLRSHIVKWLLFYFPLFRKGIGKGFRKLNIEKWLMVNFKINRLPDMHIVDRYFETVKSFGVMNDGKGLDYFIPKEDEVNISFLPEIFRNGYIGFVIGAKYQTKQLPLEKIISICKKINKPIILLGGKEAIIPISNLCYNACGKFNINQSASFVRQAKKIITHDTGLMHIAAAFKKEIISVWGNTIPEFGMYPYYGKSQITNHKSQITNLKCRPCTKLGFAKCPKEHFKCMNEIDEEEIVLRSLF
ncbi:MAG: glycosyltransferase family 9 protein [Bacteroidota bacterium]